MGLWDNEPDTSSFGGVFKFFGDLATSGPANAAVGLAKWGSKVGMFFGGVSPEIKNMIDFTSAVQDYAEHKMTGTQLANRGIQDVANSLIASKLMADTVDEDGRVIKKGWSPEAATIIAGVGSFIIGKAASLLGVDSAISGIAGMITGGSDADKVSHDHGGKSRSGQQQAYS